MTPSSLSVSPVDQARIDEIQGLSVQGSAGVRALVALLSDPSWVVRRAVVAALVRIGPAAIASVTEVLLTKRGDEAALAAAVEALVALGGDVDGAVLALAATTEDLAVVCDAAQILGRRKCRGAIPVLASWSRHENDNVAVAAIEALGRIGTPECVDPLLDALAGRNFFRTFPAIGILGQSGSPRVIEPLAALLSDRHFGAEAAVALARTGRLDAVAPLTRVLCLGDSALARKVVRALFDLHRRIAAADGEGVEVARVFAATAEALGVDSARLALPLSGPDPTERLATAAVLAWLHDPRGVETLLSLLELDVETAKEALHVLEGLRGDVDAFLLRGLSAGPSSTRLLLLRLAAGRHALIPAVVACLDDSDPGVRAQAAEALGRTGDESVVPALFAHLCDADPRVAQAALAAVQSLGGNEARDLAVRAGASKDLRMRRAALRVLSYFGYPEGLPLLLEAAKDDDERIRDAAIAGLALSDDPRAIDALLTCARHPTPMGRAAAMRGLGGTSSVPEIVAVLLTGLSDADAWVRYYACQSLGRLHVGAAVDSLIGLLDDPAGQVRVAAVDSLARLGGERALACLGTAAESTDDDVRRAAILGLGAIRRPNALPVLLKALESTDAATRIVTVSALAEDPSSESTLALLRARSDEDVRVREAAFNLLVHRRGAQTTAWLVEQLAHESQRDRALRALSSTADERVQDLLNVLETADAETSRWIVRALVQAEKPGARAVTALVMQLGNVHARRAAAEGLAMLGTKDGRAALSHAAANDPDPEVRRISEGYS